jgi:uncharacterized protein YkwD
MPGQNASSDSRTYGPIRRLRLAGLSLVAAGAILGVTASPVFAWDISAFSPGDEQLLFTLTNQDRASAGLNVLVNDGYLHSKAEWRAQDMADQNYFSHEIPPDNRMVFSYMQDDGYCFNVAGENIGLSTYGDDAATNRIEIAFMKSTSHRANILGSWVRMAVGAYKAADGRKLYTVLFSVPCGMKAPAPPPAATPVPTPAPTIDPNAPPTEVPTPQPVVQPTARPIVKATAKPTAKPTPKPTPSPSVTASPTALPTATPAPSATPLPTASAVPTATSAPTVAAPTATPSGSARDDTVPSLRVRDTPVSQGLVDSLFHSLFGGLFGW